MRTCVSIHISLPFTPVRTFLIGWFCGLNTERVPKRDRVPGVSDTKVPSHSYLRTQMSKLPPSVYILQFCKIPSSLIQTIQTIISPKSVFERAVLFLTDAHIWLFSFAWCRFKSRERICLCVCVRARVCLWWPVEVMNELQLRGPLVSMDSWWMKWKLLK